MPDNKTVTFDACREAVGRITELQRRSGGPAWMEAKGMLANDLTFIAQGLIDALAAAPTPAAQSAGQEAAANFACYLIDHCEGETVTEEGVQRWLTTMLANPQYAAPVNGGERQLTDWLMRSPENGKPLHFAGVPEGQGWLSRVKMCDPDGNEWTLTAGLREGWLTAEERAANFARISAEECAADAQQVGGERKVHEWNAEGERCVKCGDKDWMNTECSGKPAVDARAEEVAALAPILRGMIEGGSYDDPAELYAADFEAPDGDVFVRRAADLLEEYAALTSPAKVGGDERGVLIQSLRNAQEWIAASRDRCDEIERDRWDALQRVIDFLDHAALSEPPLEPSERHALDSACADIAAVRLALDLPEEDADGVDAALEAIEELKRRAALSADGGEAANLEGLREKLFDGRPVIRDAEGWYWHPAIPNADEDVSYEKLLTALRVETTFVSMEADDPEAADRYGEAGEGDCHYWTPTPPEGDDWCLLAVYDTEDGPYALFGRDAYVAEQKRKQERTRQRAAAIAANQSGKGGE